MYSYGNISCNTRFHTEYIFSTAHFTKLEFLFNMSLSEYFYAAKRDETTKSLKVSKAMRS